MIRKRAHVYLKAFTASDYLVKIIALIIVSLTKSKKKKMVKNYLFYRNKQKYNFKVLRSSD